MTFLQVFLAIGICHLILISISFPIYELWTFTPLFRIDGAFHWYQIKTAVNLSETLHVVGYDPYFNAGYPAGVIYNRSGKLAALLAILLHPWLSDIVAYKLYVFSSALIAPSCLALALHWFGFNPRTCLIGGLFGLFLWWASLFQWFYTAGMVSFVTASYLALPFAAKLIEYLNMPSPWTSIVMLGLAGAVGIFYHPLFPLPVMVVTAAYVVVGCTGLMWRRTLKVASVVAALGIIPNAWWLYSSHYYGQVFSAGSGQDPYQKLVDIGVVWRELLGLWSGTAHGSKAYAPLAFASLWAFHREPVMTREQIVVWALSLSGVFLILFAAVGAYIEPIAQLQPNRFGPVGYLLLCIPAAVGVLRMISIARESRAYRWIARASLIVITAVGFLLINEVRREVSSADIGHFGARPPHVRQLGAYSTWMLRWLESHTTKQARVLFEESSGRIYDNSNISGYLAYMSDREFIGGPYPCYPFMHFAGFLNGQVFERPIGSFTQRDFNRYLDVYNIGWIVAHSENSKRYLESLPGISLIDTFRELKTYKVERSKTFFASGNGRIVEREHNNLRLTELSGDRVVLKYHYVPGLVSEPGASIVPVKLLDDPNPFIMILNPPKQLRLYLP